MKTYQYLTYFVVFTLASTSLATLSGCAFGSLKVEDIENETARYQRADRAPASALSDEELEFRAKERDYYERARQARDIVLGMSMEDVIRVWGRPGDIDSAGDPRMGNQKWLYFSGLSSRWGMGGARIVYFEQGRVVGWKTGQD